MDTTEAQTTVAQAVVNRGYRNGWTAEQFAARQVAKMVEELQEVAGFFGNSSGKFILSQLSLGSVARDWFDSTKPWENTSLYAPMEAYKELCDVVVVALTMAGALSEIIGKPLDVVADAVAKATADVKRGTRA